MDLEGLTEHAESVTDVAVERVVAAVKDGFLDAHLQELKAAVEMRKAAIAGDELAGYKPGDRVIFNRETRPTKWIGERGTVVRPLPSRGAQKRNKLEIKLDDPAVERSIKAPLSIIDHLEDR